MEKLENSIWSEKYRPTRIEDLVLNDKDASDFRKYISTGEIPNLIFYGVQGSGKTTLARILISDSGIISNQRDNVLIINGSSKSTRGIGFVDDTIEPFLKIPPAGNDKYRIVFIDEADYLTDQAFHSLRGIVEKYTKTGRFILTCNYVSKIPDALMSRLTDYKFKLLPKDKVTVFCENILKNEKIEYDTNDLNWIVSVFYPDIRKTIAVLQKLSIDKKKLIVNKNDIEISTEKLVISLIVAMIEELKRKQISGVTTYINNITSKLFGEELDYKSMYTDLFMKKEIPPTLKIIIVRYSNEHSNCLVPEMHFMAMTFEMIKALTNYNKLK